MAPFGRWERSPLDLWIRFAFRSCSTRCRLIHSLCSNLLNSTPHFSAVHFSSIQLTLRWGWRWRWRPVVVPLLSFKTYGFVDNAWGRALYSLSQLAKHSNSYTLICITLRLFLYSIVKSASALPLLWSRVLLFSIFVCQNNLISVRHYLIITLANFPSFGITSSL